MSLYDGYEDKKEDENRKKLKKKILIAIIITFILIIVLICGMVYLSYDPNKIYFRLNGVEKGQSTEVAQLYNMLSINIDDNGKLEMYAPIKDVAKYLGYESGNGTYTVTSEDTNSCYVKNENEVAIFQVDSDVITKIDISNKKGQSTLSTTNENMNYETYTINEKVVKQNDVIYTNLEGIEKGFNAIVSYDAKTKTISINTLNYYVTALTTEDKDGKTQIQQMGYKNLDETFANQKAILEGMLVVTKETGEYGVVSFDGKKEILGFQYKSLTYMPQNSAFLFTGNDSKIGIISNNGEMKIKPVYSKLELIDNKKELYLASVDGKLYGVVDINGNVKIPLEYDKIGIDTKDFVENNITNGYIIADRLIPVCQNEKWGFFNTDGKRITNLEYDKIGCITTNVQGTSHNLLLIPEYNLIVVCKGKYGCIDLNGETKLSPVSDDIYMQTIEGKNKYYAVKGTNSREITEYMESIGYTKQN